MRKISLYFLCLGFSSSVLANTNPETSGLSFKFNGYLDMRMNAINNKDNPLAGSSGNPESGFSLEEAALYIKANQSDFNIFVDLPVRREKNAAEVSNNNNLTLGLDRAQAYMQFLLSNQTNVIVGQFDTPYGVEVNDSKDRIFAKTGLLYDYTLPITHTGVMYSGSLDSVTFRALMANSNNKGSLGSSATGDNQYEYGVTAGITNEKFRAQLGFLTRAISKANGDSGGKRDLIDLSFGTSAGRLSLDFEWAQVDNDIKADKESGDVFMILPTFKMTEKLTLGLRFESLNNDVGATGVFEKANSFGLTGHWTYNDFIKFRAEWLQNNYEAASGDDGSQTRWTLMSQFVF